MNDLFIEFLLEAEENVTELYRSLEILIKAPQDSEALKSALRVLHTLKGGFGVFQMTEATEALHALETKVEAEKKSGLGSHFFLWFQSQVPQLESLIEECRKIQSPQNLPLEFFRDTTRTEITDSESSLEDEFSAIQEELDSFFQPEEESAPLKPVEEKVDELKIDELKAESTPQKSMESYVRVPLTRIDQVLSSVWEIFMSRNQLSYLIEQSHDHLRKDPSLLRTWETLDSSLRRTIGELESQVMSLRMVPISGVFERMGRVVQQYNFQQSEKEIEFVAKGESLELDKKIVDSLADPLIHLIRNAMDHGIESKNSRMEKGKDKAGVIQLSAEFQGTEALITVKDDGGGIDPKVLREKAFEKGLHHVKDWDDSQILNVIFESGFSTAQKVSDISGRGVGMDAVKSQSGTLSGTIEVHSVPNKGSSFQIKIPSSVSVMNCLICSINNWFCAVPNSEIIEAFSVSHEEIRCNGDEEFFVYRDRPLKVIDLTKILAQNNSNKLNILKREIPVLIVSDPITKEASALIVSTISHNQEIVSKPPPPLTYGLPYVSGVSILADGRPIFLFSTSKVIQYLKSKNSNGVASHVSVA